MGKFEKLIHRLARTDGLSAAAPSIRLPHQATPVPADAAELLTRLGGTQVGRAMAAATQRARTRQKALEMLAAQGDPGAMRQVDQFLGDHKLAIGRPLGAGDESVVFEATRPGHGQHRQVVKIALRDQMQSPGGGFNLPNIPGVNPYWAAENIGPISVGAQRRALVVGSDPATSEWTLANEGMHRLDDSLRSRGWLWDDLAFQNLGSVDDHWVVIDGNVNRMKPSDPDGWKGNYDTAENAIRALRVRPYESHVFFDGPPPGVD